MTALLGELPPVVAPVDCAGASHHIRWEAGELVALDHDDPEGERALVALGAPRCTCLDVLDAWERQRGNTRLLTSLSRGARDPVRMEGLGGGPGVPYQPGATPRTVLLQSSARVPGPPMASGWVAVSGAQVPAGPLPGWPANAGGDRDTSGADLVLLANLGHPVTVRLVASATANLLDRSGVQDTPGAVPALTASLFGRALMALRDWLADPALDVELTVADRDAEPSLTWAKTDLIRLDLPLDWVVSVWGRDLPIVAGRFTVAVLESTGSRTRLSSVGSDFGAPRELVIELR